MSRRILGYRFTVEPIEPGDSFPLDMLRYDSCWPSNQQSCIAISASLRAKGHEGDAVDLFSPAKPPTIDRWLTFGWAVRTNSIQVVQI